MDTTNKRRSALGQNLPFLVILPEADGVLDIPDMQHVAGLYRFGAAGAPAAAFFMADDVVRPDYVRLFEPPYTRTVRPDYVRLLEPPFTRTVRPDYSRNIEPRD